jgi:short-subunit dehydrogenase
MTESPVVVITGASSGVGRATAHAYAARGARLGLLARGGESLEATRAEVERAGAEALAVPTDVSDAEQVELAAAAVEERFGTLDEWINNAMVAVYAPVKETQADEIRRVTEVNYLGTVHGTLAALRRMLPRDRGVIVQVGSALAYRAIPLQASYCASKHAVEGFTESLRCELLHDGSGVRITIVQLPALNTPHFGVARTRMPRHPKPVPPIFQPRVAADAIVWAAEHPQREVVVGGRNVAGLALNKVAPGLLDRYLARTAYGAQQTDEPVEPDRPDNLWAPVPVPGSRGIFDAEAHPRSLHFWARKHRLPLALALAAGLAVAARR